jgi:hypothetical protein
MHFGGLAGLVTGYKVNPLPAAGFVASIRDAAQVRRRRRADSAIQGVGQRAVGIRQGALVRIKLQRTWRGARCTIGTVYVDGKTECFSLEDVVREKDGVPVSEWKVPGETAIPEGIYGVVITPSARFKRDLPLLQNVPGFEGIRIHAGNGPDDTEGCILVGMAKTPESVTHSKQAFDALFKKIREALDAGEKVTLEIIT